MILEVPQWVRLACQRWGRQKRRIWSGRGEWYTDSLGRKVRHVDGYAESFLARVQDEKVGAGSTIEMMRQSWCEVYWGDGLEVQRNVLGIPEIPFRALHLRYVWDPEFGVQAREKAAILRLTLNAYLLAITAAEERLWRRLDPQGAPPVNQPEAKVLKSVESAAKTPPHKSNLAELSLAALRRPVLILIR